MEEFEESIKMWDPAKGQTNMDLFREHICKSFGMNLENYWELYDWSVQDYTSFWREVSTFCSIKYSTLPNKILNLDKQFHEIPEWFQGATLNYTENLLKYRDSDKVALYITGEAHSIPKEVTFSQLYDRVSCYAAAMKKLGITSEDCVVGYLPNGQEALEAYLATAAIGATWSSTSPDFGVTAVLDRFKQIKPKLLFSTDRVVYNGKVHSHLEKLKKVSLGLPELLKVVIVSDDSNLDTSHISDSCSLTEFLKDGLNNSGSIPELQFVQVPFNHPLAILYSSGTTGAPKGMVHSVGGTLIQHLKEHVIHGNLNKKDVIFYYTTIGWMMWNWLVSALAVGATVVLYDGSPFLPNSSVIFDLVDRLGITILGTSAKWLSVAEQRNLKPRTTHNLGTLHTILSSGSPLKPQSYDYVYSDIKKDLMLGSITGGSDIISCFAGQNTSIPVYRGEIQCPNLGMAMECRDDDGKTVWGSKGELVCTKPFPSMPIYFWNDASGEKYQKAYFNHFKGVWSHGDFCIFNPVTRGIIMLGRSDSILNPNGVRFGSAEIYNIVEAFDEIEDSLCVAQNLKNGEEQVVLFLKLVNGHRLDNSILDRLKLAIRSELSARHVPAVILQTMDIPYTISGKKVEVAGKKIINGEDVKQRGALANPDSLDLYYNLPELAEI